MKQCMRLVIFCLHKMISFRLSSHDPGRGFLLLNNAPHSPPDDALKLIYGREVAFDRTN